MFEKYSWNGIQSKAKMANINVSFILNFCKNPERSKFLLEEKAAVEILDQQFIEFPGHSRRENRLANTDILKRTHVAEEALPLIDHNEVAYIHAAKMQLQPQLNSAYEGIPIFIVPQNGIGPSTVSLAALQRAAEIKTALANAPQEPKIDTSKHFHVFVGDLSPEIDNRSLKEAFAVHGEVSEAKVIRDSQTQKSKGYGFVSYPLKENAEKAISSMNGHWLGRRAIRTNWATRRPADEAREKLTFEQVFNSTKPDNTSVYVGNVNPNTTENDLREPFSVHGEITEVRLFKAQGYAFVRYERKECATNAIMDMNGKEIGGNTIRCSWGRMQQVAPTTQVLPDLSPLLTPSFLPSTIAVPNMFYNPFYPQVYNPSLIPQWQA
ncbi:hypothetical protein TELCIR_00102 [Teladorsagia circumcincta]|uniref:RRM domain-containing protein n=1 Tax=Teladorsagia circumcincta TaxID=45464 RepID=A0A2G9V5I7_TELCI|nr:hypothetical protein TELCIR_00102 [Teladorsagia circumcincta]